MQIMLAFLNIETRRKTNKSFRIFLFSHVRNFQIENDSY